MNTFDVDKYAKNTGNCPFCGSFRTQEYPIGYVKRNCYPEQNIDQEVHCYDCKATWIDRYILTHVIYLNEEYELPKV